MSEGFVALAARGDEDRIAADDGLLWRFSGTGVKRALPKNGLGVLEIALDEELHFVVGDSQVDDVHLATEAVESVIAGGDDAAAGVQNEVARGILLEARKDFVEDGDFLGEVLGFALGVSGTVRPTHPGRDAVDAGVVASGEKGTETRFDVIVTADGGTAQGGKIFCPMGFA